MGNNQDKVKCDVLYLFVANVPVTPLSPFLPHSMEFPDRSLKYNLKMENGYVVMEKVTAVENDVVSFSMYNGFL